MSDIIDLVRDAAGRDEECDAAGIGRADGVGGEAQSLIPRDAGESGLAPPAQPAAPRRPWPAVALTSAVAMVVAGALALWSTRGPAGDWARSAKISAALCPAPITATAMPARC